VPPSALFHNAIDAAATNIEQLLDVDRAPPLDENNITPE